MNSLEESILDGLKFGLKEIVPENTEAIATANILNAIDLDDRFQLGIFSNTEKKAIITAEKEKYLQHNPYIKRKIKEENKR